MIPFVLAECARIENLKADALKTAELLCDDTKLFMLFFKFGLERTPKIGKQSSLPAGRTPILRGLNNLHIQFL